MFGSFQFGWRSSLVITLGLTAFVSLRYGSLNPGGIFFIVAFWAIFATTAWAAWRRHNLQRTLGPEMRAAQERWKAQHPRK